MSGSTTIPGLLEGLSARLQPVSADADRLRGLVQSAILAPSSHNSQPWVFHIPPNSAFVELYADRTRALPVADPDDRELVISCGSALFGLRLAARHAGWTDLVEPFPDTHDPDLLARLRLGAPVAPTAEDEVLTAAVAHRRTNRRRFEHRAIPDEVLRTLALSSAAQGAGLYLLRSEAERMAAAQLIAEADRRQGSDRAFRRELAAWVHPNRLRSRDGMPGYSLGIGDLASYAGPLIVRTFDWGQGRAAHDRELAMGSPVIALLWTIDDGPPAWLDAGQALYRLLLRATASGVSASFLNQPLEVPELRARMRETFGIPGEVQQVLRLGYGPDVQTTPRRAVADVMR